MLVAQDLDLHVTRPAHQLFQKDLVAAEGGLGLAPAGGDLFGQRRLVLDHPHAAAAAAPARLEHERVADLPGDACNFVGVVRQHAAGRHDRDAGAFGQRAGLDLTAKAAQGLGRRADESDAVGRAGLGQLRVFAQEAIARMNRIGLGLARDADHLVDAEIGLHRLEPAAHQVAFVRLEAMQGEAVLVGIERHGADAELAGRAQHADGDLAAVGDQQFVERPAGVRPCHALPSSLRLPPRG